MSKHKSRRHAFGQHFLRDRQIALKIASTAVEEAVKAGCHTLLEIGPGPGAITEPLMDELKARGEGSGIQEFVLCEMDRHLAQAWKDRPTPYPIRVEEADFLKLGEEKWLTSAPPLAVASNLPYSSGTAIVVKLAKYTEQIPVMVFMFQAEVAQRLRAEPNTSAWGSLSVWIQNRWDVRKLVSVPPQAFQPPPKVNSEVVILTPRVEPRVPVAKDPESEARWDSLLRVCFAHRRKMLRSGLPESGGWRKALDAARIDGTKRAEALTWEEWARLFLAVSS